MSDTPRTDAIAGGVCSISPDFARQLERDLAEAITGWAKQTKMYEQAIKERDELKACAEELANAITEGNNHGYGLKIGDEALARFNKLKGQTK